MKKHRTLLTSMGLAWPPILRGSPFHCDATQDPNPLEGSDPNPNWSGVWTFSPIPMVLVRDQERAAFTERLGHQKADRLHSSGLHSERGSTAPHPERRRSHTSHTPPSRSPAASVSGRSAPRLRRGSPASPVKESSFWNDHLHRTGSPWVLLPVLGSTGEANQSSRTYKRKTSIGGRFL